MSLSLTLTATGTNFTAAISGSGGSAVDVYYTPADRPWPGDPWILGGSRTGDGNVIVTVQPRHYFVISKTVGEVTLPGRIAVVNPADALAARCRDAVVAVLKLLNLPAIGDRVLDQVYPDGTEMKFPCIGVHLYNLAETQDNGGLNELDYISYPVRVVIYGTEIKRTDQRWVRRLELWRQSIYRAFRELPLPGVAESAYTKVEPLLKTQLDQQEPDGGQFDKVVSGFTVRCVCREPRGIGT